MSGLFKCFNTGCDDFSRREVNNCSRPLTRSRISECPEGKVKREHSAKGIGQSGKKAMTPEQRDQIWYIKEFKSNECTCGSTKRPGSSFCYTCFKALPSTYQHALYQKMGDGYEDAVMWLRDRAEG